MVSICLSLMARDVEYLLAVCISFVILCVVSITIVILMGMSLVIYFPGVLKISHLDEELLEERGRGSAGL